jgi:hypothetical protein
MKNIPFLLMLFFVTNLYSQNAAEVLMPWLINNKFVFCDSNGVQKIAAQFDYVEPFRSGYAIVGNKNKSGVMDVTGKIIVPLKFRKITYTSFYELENVNNPYGICFSINDDSIFYSGDGKLMKSIPESIGLSTMDEYDSYSEIFEKNGKYGYIELNDTSIPALYNSLSQPCDGFTIFVAKKDEPGFGMVTSDNEVLIPFEYNSISWNTENHIFIMQKENSPGSCYYVFQGSNVKNPVCCGYKRLINNFYDYLLVENQDNLVFYVEVKNGKELRK